MKKGFVALLLVSVFLFWLLHAPVPSEEQVAGIYDGTHRGYVEQVELTGDHQFTQVLKTPKGETMTSSGTWRLTNHALDMSEYILFLDEQITGTFDKPVKTSSMRFAACRGMLVLDWDTGFYRLSQRQKASAEQDGGLARAREAKILTPEDYNKAVAEAIRVSKLRQSTLESVDRKKIPHLKDFLGLYPDSIVSYLSVAGDDFPSLSVTTTLHDRYEFNMRVSVTYSRDNLAIVGYGSPLCHLLEIESVDRRGDELGGTSGGELQKHFGGQEWTALLAAKGDFSRLGYELKKDAPVKDFHLVIKHLKSLERPLPNPPEQGAAGQPANRPKSK